MKGYLIHENIRLPATCLNHSNGLTAIAPFLTTISFSPGGVYVAGFTSRRDVLAGIHAALLEGMMFQEGRTNVTEVTARLSQRSKTRRLGKADLIVIANREPPKKAVTDQGKKVGEQSRLRYLCGIEEHTASTSSTHLFSKS